MGNAVESQLRFICCAAVISMTGLCRTSLYTLPDFPRPIKIRGKNATLQGGSRWVESEVLAWMDSRIQFRNSEVKS